MTLRDTLAFATIGLVISLAAQAAKGQYTSAQPNLSVQEAIKLVGKGDMVYECNQVELKVNKSSIGLKRKPKR
jgi:hypothetical protein